MRERSRCWCFTINNPTEEDCILLEELHDEPSMRYVVMGQEWGEEKTEHIQGYIEFKSDKSLKQVKVLLPRAHLEQRKGTARQAAEYCKKEGKFIEFGASPQGQGHRKDLQDIQDMIKNGASDVDIANQHFTKWVIYRNSFTAYKNLLCSNRNWVTRVFILYGKTGTGKSRLAHSYDPDIYVCPDNTGHWFNGYNGHSTVLFDDFTGEGADLGFFLKLCDRYPMTVPVKGGFVNWIPLTIFFTSNLDPELWFPKASNEQFLAFRRRTTKAWYIEASIAFNDYGRPEDKFADLLWE